MRAVFDYATREGVRLDAPSAELDSPAWEQAEVLYKPGRQPIVAEANTHELMREEVDGFIDSLEDVGESPEKQRVLEHLQHTKAVVLWQHSCSAISTMTATPRQECS